MRLCDDRAVEPPRDRFYDERDEPVRATCGTCGLYEGHPANREYGLCALHDEWALAGDAQCGEE